MTPASHRLYAQDPIFQRISVFLDELAADLVSFYLSLLGGVFTAVLWVFSGTGILAAVVELFNAKPQYLSAAGVILFGLLMFISRISRIFFWTYLMLGFFWVTTVTIVILSVTGIHPETKFTGITAIIAATTLLLPPALVSAFIARRLEGRCVQRDLEKAEMKRYVESHRRTSS